MLAQSYEALIDEYVEEQDTAFDIRKEDSIELERFASQLLAEMRNDDKTF